MLTSESSKWEATFYDGKNSAPNNVSIKIDAAWLLVEFMDSNKKYQWRYSELGLIQKPHDGLPAILTQKKLPNSQLIISKECFAMLKGRLTKPLVDYKQLSLIFAFILMVLLSVLWVIPSSAPFLARLFPESFKDTVSLVILDHFSKGSKICYNQTLNEELNIILQSLSDENTKNSKVMVIKSDVANAFAMPNGDIILLSKLITEAESPEEVAGVIAHELGHVYHNHSMERFVRDLGITGIIDVATGGGGTMVYLGTQMYSLSYGRDEEREADEYSAQSMQKANYSLKGMHDFFSREKKAEIQILDQDILDLDSMQWMSTHPLHKERADFFINYSQVNSYKEVMPDEKWQELKKLAECDSPSSPKED